MCGGRTGEKARILATAMLLGGVILAGCAAPAGGAPTPTLAATLPNRSAAAPSLPSPVAAADIRRPAVAGSFYPADPVELQNVVDSLLAAAQPATQEPIAIIVPHAGYVYSGAVAASGFRQLQGRHYEAIVLLACSHHSASPPVSIWATGAYSTPLGLVPVDSALAEAIRACDPRRIQADRTWHLPEHSIEVELPFLLRACGAQPFVPVLIGDQSWDNVQALAMALVKALRGKKALLIASTDMSHYPSYEDALQVDRDTLLAISSFDVQSVRHNSKAWLSRGVNNLFCTLCAEGAVLTAMLVARELGANCASVLHYANSGQSAYGDKSQVVGYGAVMFWREESTMLNEVEKQALLRLARATLQDYLTQGTIPRFEPTLPGLKGKWGAFVTLNEDGQLRGCIGHMWSNDELWYTVQQMAVAAATKDPRFPPVSPEELAHIRIEISVLSPLQRVEDVSEIEVGRDGLYITYGPYSGVLLPQVATEWGWDRGEFLRQVCLKAGLPADAWGRGATLYRFQAQVFAEEE